MEETIAAISTPPGEGGVGIIRLSGPEALNPVLSLCNNPPKQLKPRHAHLVELIITNEESISDRAILTYFPAPRSYTGEDVVEISCHGSPILLQKLLGKLLETESVRLAQPGEFTRRAYSNDKLDLTQAAAVGDLISARSEAALKASARQLKGELFETIRDIRQRTINLRSQVEANLDFSDEEDVKAVNQNALKSEIEKIEEKLSKLVEDGKVGELLTSGCQVAIVGPPNVGKSSLFNLLLQKDRAIVTTQPGTTRDILRENISISGIPITLHDTAGIHDTPGLIEAEGIRRSETALRDVDLAIFLLEANQKLESEALQVNQMLEESSTPAVLVLNKLDLEQKITCGDVEAELDRQVDCKISVLEHNGIEELEDKIVKKISGRELHTPNPIVTHTHQINQLKRTISHLGQAISNLATGVEYTLVAEDLRLASEELGKITGKISSEDILDEIFSNFCIGK